MLKVSTLPIITDTKKSFIFRKANWEKFKQSTSVEINKAINELNLTDTNNVIIDKNTINTAINQWIIAIHKGMSDSIPIREIRYVNHPKESEYLKLVENMYVNLRENRYNTNPRDTLHRIKWIQEQLRIENKLNNEYWERKIKEINDLYHDQTQFWNHIKVLMGSSRENNISYLIDVENNNKKCHTDDEKLDLYNKTWKNVFRISPEENINFDQQNEDRVENFIRNNKQRIEPYHTADLNRLEADNYLTRPITSKNITDIIKEFKNKAPGKSEINKQILANMPTIAIDRLKQILNLAISMGYFILLLKNGILIFTNKPNKDNRYPLNYRPITLLEVPGKILEKIINNRLMKFLETNNKLHHNQYGFRKRRGTEAAIFRIYESIAIAEKHQHQCNVVCRDVSKAFDKVWHNGLRFKILHLELPDIMEKLLCNFISNRRVQIRYNNKLHNGFDICSGVPQGSVLSQTLYIMYTADIPLQGAGCQDIVFADDITQVIIYPHKSRKLMERRTEREIKRINSYEKEWKIQTNADKFKMLTISLTKPEVVTINNQIISNLNKLIILGLTIGRTGLNSHIKQRLQMARQRYKKLERYHQSDSKIKNHLYKSVIRPTFEYPIAPISIMSKTNREKYQ